MLRVVCRVTPRALRMTLKVGSAHKRGRSRIRSVPERGLSQFGPPSIGAPRNNTPLTKLPGNEQPVVVSEPFAVSESDDEEYPEWLQTVKEGLDDLGISLPHYEPGTQRLLCPKCDGGSTSELSFNVTLDYGNQVALYNCFRATCEYQGSVRSESSTTVPKMTPIRKVVKAEKLRYNLEPLDAECQEFFESRRISAEVLERNRVQMEMKAGRKFIAFPYYVSGEIVNVKYRLVDGKEFHQTKGGEKVLYGLDDVKEEDSNVIIVEGEMDKLALEVAGYQNVVSVPDGAPGKVKNSTPSPHDKKFSYLEKCDQLLKDGKQIVIATDNDGPGTALAEELARRFGHWKCWKVLWPRNFESTVLPEELQSHKYSQEEMDEDAQWFRKDANEVLMRDGPEILSSYIELKEQYPVPGLVNFNDYTDEILKHYDLQDVCPHGYSTGWSGLDQYYRVVPGELTVVSGVPNSGKSEWLDALAVNLAEMFGWSIAFAIMEKSVPDHGRQLIEKHIGLPFSSRAGYAKGYKQMSRSQMLDALEWIAPKFPLIRDDSDQLPTVDWILETAVLAVRRQGIRGLVIDPYNELDHGRPARMSETEFISGMLSKIKRFARAYQVHVWLVAHPRQLHDWRGEPPNLYDISGSAHFVNKADAGIVIHRNWQKFNDRLRGRASEEALSDEEQREVRIIIRKMRNKAAGKIGEHVLQYNRANGRYSEP